MKAMQKLKVKQKHEPNLLSYFLGKSVIVDSQVCTVQGRLIRYQLGYRKGHLPTVLILKGEHGFIILRSWRIIKQKKGCGEK